MFKPRPSPVLVLRVERAHVQFFRTRERGRPGFRGYVSMELEPCKARRLGRRQLQYLTGRLRDIDVDVYVTNIAKQMEEEAVQLTTFECRGEMWRSWKSSGELKLLAVFLLTGFCDLLETHATGKERFARFLFAWYEFVSTVSVATRETAASQKVWVEKRKKVNALQECRKRTLIE